MKPRSSRDQLAPRCAPFKDRRKLTVRLIRSGVLMASLLVSGEIKTHAATNTISEVESIRLEMQKLRDDYESRIQSLERRLQEVESAQSNTNRELPVVMDYGLTNQPATTNTWRNFARQHFQQDTETREWSQSAQQAAAVKVRVEKVLNDFIDIGGYFRAGYGRDDKGGPQPAFQAPGAFAKYRLGNEAENYGELIIGKNWYAPDLFQLNAAKYDADIPDAPIARTQVRVAFYDPYESSGSSGFETSLPEAWAEIANVVPSQPSLKFWGGSRFYRRQDIHINDFFFQNMSGSGGGFEDLELPFGKLALAWIGNGAQSGIYSSDIAALPDPANQAGFSKQSLDLSLYDVPVSLGTAEFTLIGSLENSGKDSLGHQAEDSEGVAVSMIHVHDHFLSDDGQNKFSLQFGSGAAKTFTSGYETATLTNGTFIVPDDPSSWRFRATESFVAQPWEYLSISPALVYQYTDYHGPQGRVHWVSAGVRPVYQFTEHLSLAFEGGADYVDDSASHQSGALYKLTLAPQVSLSKGFFSRPVIRAFVTFATWSDEFKGQIGGNDYTDDTSAWTWGIQMESWW